MHLLCQVRGWGLFNDLLVSPLQAAVSVKQVEHVAVAVCKHLGVGRRARVRLRRSRVKQDM